VSTDDQQDPTLSLPRQLGNSQAALPPGWEITAWFIESGRTELERRGHGRAHEDIAVPLPRDGGLADLLAEAEHPGRRFTAVICESIDRIARRTYIGTHIEHKLERHGVRLCAADEPIDLRGKRSTGLLTRRIKQGVAEWYVADMLERSWDGFKIHTDQGWNIGKPPYGYTAHKVDHPVPAKAAEGATKTRLVPDPARAPVVAQIFAWRLAGQLGYDAIAKRLNTDHQLYPPPEPTSARRRRGTWSGSSVREILTNPKYTGYMVWNRRATKSGGRNNPPEAWIWSSQPTHEPLITRETFDAVAAISGRRRGSRSEPGINTGHPQARRSYALRSYVRCGDCGQRMFGKTRRGHAYYSCYPANNNADQLARYGDHPKSVYVREDALLGGVGAFLAERVFGPDRLAYYQAGIKAAPSAKAANDAQRAAALHHGIEDLTARQDRLLAQLETADPDDRAFTDRIRRRFDTLETERAKTMAKLEELEKTLNTQPTHDVELLDAVPLLEGLNITAAPERIQRKLYDALRLEVHHQRPDHAHIKITLTEHGTEALTALKPVTDTDTRAHEERTPPKARTCATTDTLATSATPTDRHRVGIHVPINTGRRSAVTCVFAGQHSARRLTDNCYSDYAQRNATQLIGLLTSEDTELAEL